MSMLEFHPLANLFPMIEGDDFDALVADIRVNGLRDRIVTLDGAILDGRNRYRAGMLADVVPADGGGECFRKFDPVTDGAELAFVLSKNLSRRHLNESQRAMVAARLADMRQGARTDKVEPSANLRKVDQETAAKNLNVSARLVSSAKAVQDKGTEKLNHAVDSGKLSASAAAQASKLPAEQQDRVADMAEEGKANPVRTVIKQGVRDAREKALGAKITALPDKRFGVILADPEWEFVTFSKITGLDRSAANHYPCSPWEAIGARDVQKISAKDCLCLMWVTDLKRGIAVLESWGFEYKSYFVWVKDIVEFVPPGAMDDKMCLREIGPAGTGYWNRDRDEICLIGTRGDVVCPAMGTQGESVWFAARPKIEGTQRGKHSAKPDNAHLWLEEHYPNTPKIELNARAGRAGWDSWGNEAPPPQVHEENQDRFEYEFNQEPREPSDLEILQDGEASSEAGLQAEASLAGTGSETLAGHEGDSAAITPAADSLGGGSVATRMQDEARKLFEKRPRWQGNIEEHPIVVVQAPFSEPTKAFDLGRDIPSFLRRTVSQSEIDEKDGA